MQDWLGWVGTGQKYLKWEFLGNTGSEIVFAIGVFLLLVSALYIFRGFVLRSMHKLAKKTKTDLDDIIITAIRAIRWPFYFMLSIYAGLIYLEIPGLLEKIVRIIIVVQAVWYAIKAAQAVINYFTKKELKRREKEDVKGGASFVKILGALAKAIIWALALLFVLANFGVEITPLLAGLGVGGIAIAFALQNILEDLFSSFTIYFDEPFKEGDFIVIGDDMGTVKHIGLKTTRITTLQGQELVVSNRELTTTRINNYKRMERRRIVFSIGVEYETPLKKLKKIPEVVKKIYEEVELCDLDRVHFKSFGDYSLNYEIVYYLNSSDYNVYMNKQQEINFKLAENFEKEKIEFAFPTQTIHVKK